MKLVSSFRDDSPRDGVHMTIAAAAAMVTSRRNELDKICVYLSICLSVYKRV